MAASDKDMDISRYTALSVTVRPRIAFVFGVLSGILLGHVMVSASSQSSVVDVVSTPVTNSSVGIALESALPTRLRIPALQLDVPFSEPLGVNAEGAVEVPETYDTVGWYQFGPTPGALGPAVVLGHVDSYEGPAVFFSLGQLEPGDDIYVDREDGRTAHFVVTRLERPSQSEFPTEEVYGDLPYAGLRLITCTGTYVRSVQRYTHNLIVFAELKSQE